VRNISINDVDHSPRSVLAIGTDYPPGHVLAAHEHRRAQFLFAVNGAMNVETEDGEWTVLPSNAVMIPAGVAHAVTMDGVSTRSLYIEPSAAPWFPVRCRVVAVSSLLRELLVAAVDMDVELNVAVDFPAHGRGAAVFQLILHELRDLAPLPVELPLPRHPGLRALCTRYLTGPSIHDSPTRWAEQLHISERTLHRLLISETGISASSWMQRACILHALPKLSAGASVTAVASELGYSTPAAFTAMCTRVSGAPPSSYRARVTTQTPE
jgi:AraC-like DNA-binding protein/mannose-6-phosphate isomerase-like protein (cupin superfamily)